MGNLAGVSSTKKVGEGIRAVEWNTVVNELKKLTNITGIRGIKVVNSLSGIVISTNPRVLSISREPATVVKVVNTDTGNALPVMTPAGISGHVFDDAALADEYTSRRILELRQPTQADAQNFVIMSENIVAASVADDRAYGGYAFCDGICGVKLVRWFAADEDAVKIHRADAMEGCDYLVANVDGPVEILWEEEFTTDDEHFAVVKFSSPKHQALNWYNVGAGTVDHGCPIVPDRAGYGTGLTGVNLALERPTEDAGLLVYVNIGGTVATTEVGRCIFPGAMPFLGRLNTSCSVGDPVGAKAATTTFLVGSFGFRALAYLGTYSGQYWAILCRDPQLPLLKATSAVVADEQDVETADEDGGLSGVTIVTNALD